MKKMTLLLIASVVALTFAACNSATADLKWKTKTGFTSGVIQEITWAQGDAVWSNLSINSGDTETTFKEVTELNGSGDCILDGDFATIELLPSECVGVEAASTGSAILKENAQVTLVIDTATVAKK